VRLCCKPFAFLTDPGFGYVIRFRGNIRVADATGESRLAAEWVGKAGRSAPWCACMPRT
jgi:hypothetical protein